VTDKVAEENRESCRANHRHFLFTLGRYTASVSDTLVVNEIYLSLQGESTFAGLPCVFIRSLPAICAARIATLPTPSPKAKENHSKKICTEVRRLAAPFRPPLNPQPSTLNSLPLVELTGGEPCSRKVPCR